MKIERATSPTPGLLAWLGMKIERATPPTPYPLPQDGQSPLEIDVITLAKDATMVTMVNGRIKGEPVIFRDFTMQNVLETPVAAPSAPATAPHHRARPRWGRSPAD